MMTTLVSIVLLLCGVLAVFWHRSLGITRAFMAAACRAGWVIPLILSLVPEILNEQLPRSLALQTINVLVDDSDSMRDKDFDGSGIKGKVHDFLKTLDHQCLQYGCMPRVAKLSEMHDATAKGFTPLSSVLEPWLFKVGAEPWILVADGGDWRPALPWDEKLRGRGTALKRTSGDDRATKKNQGLVVGFGATREPNFWIEDAEIPPFAFEGRPVSVRTAVKRFEKVGAPRIQVQALIDGKPVTSITAQFGEGATAADAVMSFSSPSRGPHLLTVRALPVAGEKDIWDNELHRDLDVMPNTIGVLHLLGAPSWDGRFMRRYIKAEPKFDLISFFILRDPWDSQQVNEREMSLIPFPVERLFKTELANFRVLVIQNFTMIQFLQPEYQRNLVQFVRDGGGLLFVGGPRSLTMADLQSSALSGILPFDATPSQEPNLPTDLGDNPMDGGNIGSTWDAQEHFDVSLAQPDAQKRALANVYDEWEHMGDRLTSLKSMRGIHRMADFHFKQNEITPLLNAKLHDGKVVPLAVASYPGKGRAIWLFTDSLWRVAMTPQPNHARADYQDFMDAAMTWLMRGDRKPPLVARDFRVESNAGEQTSRWRVLLTGPAARFAKNREDWHISICGRAVTPDQYGVEQHGGDVWELSGEAGVTLRGGALCALVVTGDHPAFGSIHVQANAVFPETLSDEIVVASPQKLAKLAELTGATYAAPDVERGKVIESWLQAWTGREGAPLPNRFRTVRDFYWILNRDWIWIILLLLPLEVLIRRWHLLVGRNTESIEDERL